MLVPSMTPQELEAAVFKDFREMYPRVQAAYERFQSARRLKTKFTYLHSVSEEHTFRTKAGNKWNILFQHCSYSPKGKLLTNCIHYIPLYREKGTDYIFLIGDSHVPAVEVFTSHFIRRYQERYLEPNHVDLKGTHPVLYYLLSSTNRGQPIFIQGPQTESNELCNFFQTEQGLACFSLEGRVVTYITFLDQKHLTSYKQEIYEERQLIDSMRIVINEDGTLNERGWSIVRDKWLANKEHTYMLLNRHCKRLRRWGMDQNADILQKFIDKFKENTDYHTQTSIKEKKDTEKLRKQWLRDQYLHCSLPQFPPLKKE